MALVIVVVLTAAMLLLAAAFADRVWNATRASRLGWQGERALHLADAALLQTLASWSAEAAAAQRIGETDTVATRTEHGTRTAVSRTRLSARTFSMEASSTVQDGGVRAASSRIGRTLLLHWPVIPADAALTVLGHVNVGAGAEILGADAVPAEWEAECHSDPRVVPTAAVRAIDATLDSGATVAGAGAPLWRVPTPPLLQLSAQLDAALARVAAVATVVTSDSVLSLDELAGAPACPQWFGDARRRAATHPVCTRRWPVVAATNPGETRLTGTAPAQGVLVVTGDLHIDGAVRFSGLILVGGHLTVAPIGGAARPELVGAILVRDRDRSGSTVNGPTLIQVSQCATRLALAAIGVPVPQTPHGWTLRP